MKPAGLVPALGATNQRVTMDPILIGVNPADPLKEMQTINYRLRSDGTVVIIPDPYPIPAGTMVHVPPTLTHNAEYNGISVLLMQDNRYVFSGQALALEPGGNPGWARTADTTVDGTGPVRGWIDLYGHGTRGQHGGSGLAAFGGVLRAWEYNDPSVDTFPMHVLSMNLDGLQFLSTASGGFRWPAFKADTGYNDETHQNFYGRTGVADGEGGTYDGMRMGVLLGLPSGYSSAWATDPLVRKLAKTLEFFGAYVVDVTTGNRHAFSVEESVLSSWNNRGATFHSEMQTLITALRYVDNNTSITVGGGGVPRITPVPDVTPP